MNFAFFLPATKVSAIALPIPYFDKIIHFCLFFILTLFFIIGFILPIKWSRQGLIIVLVFTFYAFLTEIIQLFCQRGCDFYDFLADFLGCLLAWVTLQIILHLFYKFSKKN